MHTQIPKEIRVNTIYEAEKQVYQLILQSIPQNKIVGIIFFIGEHKKQFNPSQISKIKKKFENMEESNEGSKDYLTAELFRYFEKGYTVLQIVLKKDYKSEIVETAYEKYLKLKEMELVPKWFMNSLREHCYKLECHYAVDKPTPKEKIDFMGIDTYLGDCADISILSETVDLRIDKPKIEQHAPNNYRSKEKPVFYSIFQ